ncbi:hypothetical protein IJJ49_01190 [Candidatus Saccharibacteria bacterium]|nr:hypothetical protein [Candidatus Saccharibacteria bacterium]
MKNKIRFGLLALIISSVFLNANPASASIVSDDGHTWYSFRELIPIFNHSLDVTREFCDEYDYDCWRHMYEIRGGSIPELGFADMFFGWNFTPVTINPALGAMTAVFSDAGLWERSTFDWSHNRIDEVYLAWFDDSDPNVSRYDDFAALRRGEDVPGAHTIFSWRSYEYEFPYLEEVEIPLMDALPEEGYPTLYYYIYSTTPNGSSTEIGVFSYYNCTNSDNYEPGMECRLFFPDNLGTVYVPFWPGDDSDLDYEIMYREEDTSEYGFMLYPERFFHWFDEDEEPFEDEPTEDNPAENEPTEDNPTEDNSIEDDPVGNGSDEDDPERLTGNFSDSESGFGGDFTDFSPTVPDTGSVSSEEYESPWWFKVIIGVNTIIFTWLFWPNSRRKTGPKPKKN